MKPFIIFSLLVLLLDINKLPAQTDLRFDHLSVRDGLSQNSVTSIFQDNEGFMWFGTEDGLNKFDGYSFTQFNPDPKEKKISLQDSNIRDIFEDKNGRLWVSTYGLHLLDKRTNQFTAYLVDSTQFTYLNIGLSMHEDKYGKIWFSAGGGLNQFDPKTEKFTSYETPQLTANFGLVEDENGYFYIGSGAELLRFSPETGSFTSFSFDLPSNITLFVSALLIDTEGILWVGTYNAGLFHLDTRRRSTAVKIFNPGNQVNSKISNNGIFEDGSGYIWIATSEGLQRIDKKNKEVRTFKSNPAIPGSISSNNVLSVYEDREGILWVGTDNGINKLITYAKPFHSHQIKASIPSVRLDENKINSIVEDQQGMVWLGTQKGLYRFDPEDKYPKYILLGQDISFNSNALRKDTQLEIKFILEDKSGRIWVGISQGLFFLNPDKGTNTFFPFKIPLSFGAMDVTGKFWMLGTGPKIGNAVMVLFDPENLQSNYIEYAINDPTGLKDGYMHGITASRTGDMYVASGMWGIGHMDQNTGIFSHHLPNPQSPGSMVENDIWCLYEDTKGIIWAGTKMGGLNRFDPKTGVFTNYTTHDGLPSNQVTSIAGDLKGNLWLGTGNGLSCFNPKTQTFRNFDMSDGLPDNAFRLSSAYAQNENLYFGTDNGLVVFNPDSIQVNTDSPSVYITGVKVLDHVRELPDTTMELSYDQNFLSFDFTALDYHSPERLKYAYMLENFNENWIESGTRRYAAYTNLDPGEYIFRVKASNRDGIWNETGASLPIIIQPPWWKTSWAYLSYTLLGIGLLIAFRQLTLNRERMKNDLKIKQMEAEKLHELEETRSRFFANISHEFRTPLTLILGPLEDLLGKGEEKLHQVMYRTMEQNARRLLHLINQLLELSKLESGNLKLEPQPQNLENFLKILTASFHSLAESRNINFQIHFEGINQIFAFDGDKVEKIVGNLLSNAFKFTPDGGFIKVFSVFQNKNSKAKKEGTLKISISDSGIGIAKEDLENIFNRFYQVDGSKTRKQGGTGIGLALVKELVELHNGTISVDSEVNNGTTFTVMLPIFSEEVILSSSSVPEPYVGSIQEYSAEPEYPMHQLNQETNKTNREENATEEIPRLLLVEDNRELSAYIANSFHSQFEVLKAFNGRQGLEVAIATVPDMIISDVMMPEMDGKKLCEILKSDERTSHIPVILLTAKAGEKNKLEGLETGADDYLTKPFSGPELRTRVYNLIEGRKRLRERFSREIRLQPSEIAITSADEKFLERIMAMFEANYMESNFSIESLEKEAGFSRTQFYRKLKALTDQAPGEFLRNFRLQKAVMLLKGGQGNVSEAAYGVGFNSLSYFTRCFKEFYGKSPSEYMAKQTTSGKSSGS